MEKRRQGQKSGTNRLTKIRGQTARAETSLCRGHSSIYIPAAAAGLQGSRWTVSQAEKPAWLSADFVQRHHLSSSNFFKG